VQNLAERMASVPKNQLMMQKLMINSAYENMGLSTTQVRCPIIFHKRKVLTFSPRRL